MELLGIWWCCHGVISCSFPFSASGLMSFDPFGCVVLFGVPVLALSFPLVLRWLESCIVDSIIVVNIVVVSVVATGGAVGVVVAVDDVGFGVWSGLRCWGPAATSDSSATTATTAITVAIVETMGRKVLLGGCRW